MQEFITHTPEETQVLAHHVVDTLASMRVIRGTGTIIALQGNLGAGKTVFAKGVAEVLGVEEVVTSPTFVIEKVYQLSDEYPWKRFVHIDAYRLTGESDLHTIGWSEIATDPGNIVVLEWPEQVGLGVPERAVWLSFEQVDETTRKITVEGVEL